MSFLRGHYEAGDTDILAICTGVFVCGYAGILDGKWATGPRALVPMLREMFPRAKGWDETRRVVRDGRAWSCGLSPFPFPSSIFHCLGQGVFRRTGTDRMMIGGITNGHDLVAQYLRETYPPALVNVVLAMADVPERSVKYDTGPARDNIFFLWQVLRVLPSAVFRMIRFS